MVNLARLGLTPALLLVAASGCTGWQLARVEDDAGDAQREAGSDAVADTVAIDSPHDSQADVTPDIAMDASPDADAVVLEAGSDVQADVQPDACIAMDPIDAAGFDSNCDGADGVVSETLYVSQTGSDTSGDGSPGHPYATVATAAMHLGARNTVLIASGTHYSATGLAQLLSTNGVTVAGGYETTHWSRPAGASSGFDVPNTGVRVQGSANATLEYVQLTAASTAMASSPHSIALVLENTSGFSLANATLTSGTAATGATGAPGATAPSYGAALAGQPGSPDAPASGCNGTCTGGGVAAHMACLGATTTRAGGVGGQPPTMAPGQNGEGGAAGGLYATFMSAAIVGTTGSPGGIGAAGMLTSLTPTWNSGAGTINVPANTGGGIASAGGGGGGGGYWTDSAGASVCGGGGGGGGCGGGGGGGGGAGGFSVPLVVVGSPVNLTAVTLTHGRAGGGGMGGSGAPGASGGAGSHGQRCTGLDSGSVETGGQGGGGGAGGQGGGGAGGNGGVSAGLVTFGGIAQSIADAMIVDAAGGNAPGGPGGSPNGPMGNPGTSVPSYP